MKQTSITKLSEVYNNLNALYNGEKIAHDYKSLANLIQQVIRAEAMTDAKKGKFNIFNYVAKDNLRPVMNGVFHNEGFKVASDAHILVAIKEDYADDMEGKVLLPDGSFETSQVYPKWRSVIPKPDGYTAYQIDAQKFYDWLTERRTAYKTINGKGCKFQTEWCVKVGPAFFKAELFDRLLSAMDFCGATELNVGSARKAAYAKTDMGICLLMPLIESETALSASLTPHICVEAVH